MESRVVTAEQNHLKGYNCAQSVACAYADICKVSENEMFAITEGFGLGMGGMGCTCGAISGAVAVLGKINSSGDISSPTTKQSTYRLTKRLCEEFNKKVGATTCRVIKGVDGGKVLCSCHDAIVISAMILEELLKELGY